MELGQGKNSEYPSEFQKYGELKTHRYPRNTRKRMCNIHSLIFLKNLHVFIVPGIVQTKHWGYSNKAEKNGPSSLNFIFPWGERDSENI